jgi:hypothetical protein
MTPIEDALHKRYPPDAYALLFQVPNGTGSHKSRTADALAFGMWPSRGLNIEGIEIKVSRSDWRRELEDVGKAATFSVYCHRWWIAAPPNVVESGELPPKWGLLELRNGVLRQTVEAPPQTPTPMPHQMWIAVMRSVRNVGLAAIERRRREIETQAKSDAGQRYEELLDRVAKFKEATGIDVRYSYNTDEIGRALTMIKDGEDYRKAVQKLKSLTALLRGAADKIEEIT